MVVILETVDQAAGEVRDANSHILIFICAVHYQAELIGGWVREYLGKDVASADGGILFVAGSTCDADLAIAAEAEGNAVYNRSNANIVELAGSNSGIQVS